MGWGVLSAAPTRHESRSQAWSRSARSPPWCHPDAYMCLRYPADERSELGLVCTIYRRSRWFVCKTPACSRTRLRQQLIHHGDPRCRDGFPWPAPRALCRCKYSSCPSLPQEPADNVECGISCADRLLQCLPSPLGTLPRALLVGALSYTPLPRTHAWYATAEGPSTSRGIRRGGSHSPQ